MLEALPEDLFRSVLQFLSPVYGAVLPAVARVCATQLPHSIRVNPYALLVEHADYASLLSATWHAAASQFLPLITSRRPTMEGVAAPAVPQYLHGLFSNPELPTDVGRKALRDAVSMHGTSNGDGIWATLPDHMMTMGTCHWLLSLGYDAPCFVPVGLIKQHRRDAIACLMTAGSRWNHMDMLYATDGRAATAEVIAFMDWMLQKQCTWGTMVMAHLASLGDVELMRWAHAHGCSFVQGELVAAVSSRNVDSVAFVLDHTRDGAADAVAEALHLNALGMAKVLHREGCALSPSCWAGAIQHDNGDAMRWLGQHGVAVPRNIVSRLLRCGVHAKATLERWVSHQTDPVDHLEHVFHRADDATMAWAVVTFQEHLSYRCLYCATRRDKTALVRQVYARMQRDQLQPHHFRLLLTAAVRNRNRALIDFFVCLMRRQFPTLRLPFTPSMFLHSATLSTLEYVTKTYGAVEGVTVPDLHVMRSWQTVAHGSG